MTVSLVAQVADGYLTLRELDERKLPLVVILIRELNVDELSLIAALRKQTRVPLLDPAHIQVDPEALRLVPRASCNSDNRAINTAVAGMRWIRHRSSSCNQAKTFATSSVSVYAACRNTQ